MTAAQTLGQITYDAYAQALRAVSLASQLTFEEDRMTDRTPSPLRTVHEGLATQYATLLDWILVHDATWTSTERQALSHGLTFLKLAADRLAGRIAVEEAAS